MIVSVPSESIRYFLGWFRAALLVIAVGALGYSGFVLADTWLYQKQAGIQFNQRLNPALLNPTLLNPTVLNPAMMQPRRPNGPSEKETSGLVGRMEIPRLGISVIVAEGTSEATLRRAAGHIAGTKLPGRSGNVGIAGHRDTLFRPLRNVQQGDLITLTTLQGAFHYVVLSTQIVARSDVGVLNSDGREILTLVTCHPFYFVGPAPDRFIVRAERIPGST
jgi:sortase A